MSSYLNIYIKLKGTDNTVDLTEYSRSHPMYDVIREEVSVVYIGNDDKPRYSDLSAASLNAAVNEYDQKIAKETQRINTRMDALEFLDDERAKKVCSDILSDIDSIKEYREELEENKHELEHLAWLANIIEANAECSWHKTEKLVANID